MFSAPSWAQLSSNPLKLPDVDPNLSLFGPVDQVGVRPESLIQSKSSLAMLLHVQKSL